MIIKAVIQEFNGGRYGKMGERIALVEPKFFKNGKMIKSDFHEVAEIETIKKGYGYGYCAHSQRIKEVLEVVEDDGLEYELIEEFANRKILQLK